MKRIKVLFQQTVIITFFIQMVLVISEIMAWFKGETFDIPWFIPGSIVLMSFLASVPSLVLNININAGKWGNRLIIFLHYIMLFAIVGYGGKVFYWYTTFEGFLQFGVSFTIIYILVWLCMGLMNRHDEKVINEALQKMQDDE